MPLVSVVIPTYQRARQIAATTGSAASQTLQDIEIIVVDDCSDDDTQAVVEALGDPRIRCIRHDTNRGGNAARNTGIRAASGEYIAFLDSDDCWHPEKLAEQVVAMERHGDCVGLCMTWFRRVDASGTQIREYHPALTVAALELYSGNSLGGFSGALARRGAILDIGGLDESLASCQDWDFYVRLNRVRNIIVVPRVLVDYYDDPTDLVRITNRRTAVVSGNARMLDTLRRHAPELPPTVVQIGVQTFWSIFSWCGAPAQFLAAARVLPPRMWTPQIARRFLLKWAYCLKRMAETTIRPARERCATACSRDTAGTARSTNAGPGARRVLFVEFSPSGGLFQFAAQLGEALSRRGAEVTLLTGPKPELASRTSSFTVRPALPTWHPTAGSESPSWVRKARRVWRGGRLAAAWGVVLEEVVRTKPDVVLFSTWRFPLDAWFVRLLDRLVAHTKLGIIAHEPRPLVEQPGQYGLYKESGVLHAALKGAWAAMDVVFVLGESVRDQARATWPVACPIYVIPHGGDENVFVGQEPAPVAGTAPRVLFFGTITAYKGHDDLLAVWPAIVASVPEARLTVAGSVGADVDAAALAARVRALPGVTLRAGYVPIEQVASLFEEARCVVLPYRRSSQSGVAHLAFSFGRPVVATCVGAIPTVVRDGETGLLVEVGDPDALVAAVTRLLRDPAEAHRLGAAGLALVGRGGSWDEVAAKVEAGLEELLATPRRPAT